MSEQHAYTYFRIQRGFQFGNSWTWILDFQLHIIKFILILHKFLVEYLWRYSICKAKFNVVILKQWNKTS